MTIPKYVQELMQRSQYEFNHHYYSKYKDNYDVGYTIEIEKSSTYGYAETLLAEIERLKKWVERQAGGEMIILEFPKETHYRRQYAVVTIFDPVMKYLESYIPSEEERKAKRKHVYS